MPKGKLLHSDQSPIAREIRERIGAGPKEEVEIVTPTFNRAPHEPTPTIPPDVLWQTLSALTATQLRRLGCKPWDESGLMLFPAEWYDHIPDGLDITDINGNRERFRRGDTDDDRRFGCLAYGVIATKEGGTT